MSANQLPENMGRKIVEALKKQALLEEQNNINQMQINEAPIQKESVITEQQINETPVIREVVEQTEFIKPQIQSSLNTQSIAQNLETSARFSVQNELQQKNNMIYNTYSAELPTNVAVLKKLILQLPSGVSKQVGAQIIRQTIEALGISMNSVLQEAQQVQEGLSSNITDCTLKIQEYKNQILQLEASSKEYQRQMAQINDLISLFILTDNQK